MLSHVKEKQASNCVFVVVAAFSTTNLANPAFML